MTKENDPINSAYAIGGAAFDVVCQEFEKLRSFERLLEFGSGASTLAFARRYPGLIIDSVDHDRQYAAQVPSEYKSRVRVNLVSMKRQLVKGVWCHAYDYEPRHHYDAVLVDGPPSKYLNGRFAALVMAQKHLKPGGVIILDDAKRFTELFWSSLFVSMTGSNVSFFEAGHGLIKFSDLSRTGRLPRFTAMGAFVSSSLRLVGGSYGV